MSIKKTSSKTQFKVVAWTENCWGINISTSLYIDPVDVGDAFSYNKCEAFNEKQIHKKKQFYIQHNIVRSYEGHTSSLH